MDEAFLRRIRYKVEVKSPTKEQYKATFQRVCHGKGLAYDEDVVDYLWEVKYPELSVEPRAVHLRDVIEQIIDYCDYMQAERRLSRESMDVACLNYFVRL